MKDIHEFDIRAQLRSPETIAAIAATSTTATPIAPTNVSSNMDNGNSNNNSISSLSSINSLSSETDIVKLKEQIARKKKEYLKYKKDLMKDIEGTTATGGERGRVEKD